jgi:hypothetical protein
MCSGGWREFSAKSLLVRLVRTSQVNSSLNQPVNQVDGEGEEEQLYTLGTDPEAESMFL